MFFRHGFLKDSTIDVISQTGGAGRHNHSYESLLWLLLQKIHYPGLQFEKVLLKAPVDGFHEATNTVQKQLIPKLFSAWMSKVFQR